MSSALDQAQNFSGGVVAAARKRESWLRKAANTSNEETAAQYREAAADLAERYPDIAEIPPGGAEAFARERGHGRGSRSPIEDGRARQRTGSARAKVSRKPAAKPKPAPAAKPSSRASGAGSGGRRHRRSSTTSSTRSSRPAPTPRLDRAIGQTGIPQALEGGSSTSMALLGGTVGLAFAFLVLHSAEKPGSGVAAVPTLMNKIGRALGRFLSPEKDVFPGPKTGSGGNALSPQTQREIEELEPLPSHHPGPQRANPFASPGFQQGARRVRGETRQQERQRRQKGAPR